MELFDKLAFEWFFAGKSGTAKDPAIEGLIDCIGDGSYLSRTTSWFTQTIEIVSKFPIVRSTASNPYTFADTDYRVGATLTRPSRYIAPSCTVQLFPVVVKDHLNDDPDSFPVHNVHRMSVAAHSSPPLSFHDIRLLVSAYAAADIFDIFDMPAWKRVVTDEEKTNAAQ